MNPIDSLDEAEVRGIFRVMLSGIFLVAGSNHLLRPALVAGRLEKAPLHWLATWLGPPELLVVVAGLVLVAGGLGLLTGFATRWAAAILLFVVVPITLTVQVGRVATLGPLFKNVGLMGGLLYFAARGAGAWSLDAYLHDSERSSRQTSTT